MTPSKLHPSRGKVRMRMTTLNQNDQPVQTMIANLLARLARCVWAYRLDGAALTAPRVEIHAHCRRNFFMVICSSCFTL